MKIKVELTDEEVKRLGFKKAMNLKWDLEALLDSLVDYDDDAKELINEIQKKN